MHHSISLSCRSAARTTLRNVALAAALGLVSAAASFATDSVASSGDHAFPEKATSTHDGMLHAGSDGKPSLPFYLFAVPIPK